MGEERKSRVYHTPKYVDPQAQSKAGGSSPARNGVMKQLADETDGWRSCISTVRTCQKVFASIKDQIDNMHVLSYVLLTQTRLGSIVLWNSNPLEGQGATSCAQGLRHPQTE